MNIVKIALTSLAAPLGSSDLAYTLSKLVDSQGNPVSLSDFGTWFVTVIKSGDTTEIIYNTNLVQNDDGSCSVTVGANGRDILPKPPYTGTTEGQDFPAGADVIVTNDPYTMSRFVQLDNTNLFTVTPQTTAGDPTLPTELTRKAYVDALVLGTLTTLDVIVPGIAGETVAAGQGVYLNEATGRWNLWDADTVATVDNVLLGIAQGAGTAALAIASGVLLQGVDAHQIGMTQGTVMYAGNTPGQITAVPGTEVVTVGIAKDATNLYFAPRFNMQLTKTGYDFLNALTGMSFMWNDDASAPTGFLLENGSLYANNSYVALLSVLRGRNGVDTGTTFTANAGTDVITAATHGLSAGQVLLLDSSTTLPGGLSQYTLYYVINPTTNTFQLATSAGGSAVNITDAGTGTHSYHTQFKVPDSRGRVMIGAGTGTKAATFVSRASNVITAKGLTNANNNEFQTGQAIVYSAPGGAMTGLSDAQTYYLIRLSNSTFSLATTLALAQAGTPIALSSDGSGVQTFTLTLTARAIGDTGGEENHAMSITELLSHAHTGHVFTASTGASTFGVGTASGVDNGNISTSAVGGNASMNNMQPFGTKTFIIKT